MTNPADFSTPSLRALLAAQEYPEGDFAQEIELELQIRLVRGDA